MITNNGDNTPAPVPRKGLTLQPLHDDTPAATVPTNQAELENLRRKIEAINSTTAAIVEKEPLVIEQAQGAYIAPAMPDIPAQTSKNAAMKMVRDKLNKLYAKEPDAVDEAIESFQVGASRSKHQQYMYDLTTSGKSLAEIQTAWHNYYTHLSDNEKHQVWQEFYSAHNAQQQHLQHVELHQPTPHAKARNNKLGHSSSSTKTTAELKESILNKVSAGGKLKAKHHIQSLLFGLGMASLFVIVLLFGFFNERFIAPFMSPSRQVSATPIVGNSTSVGPESKVIIPKINLEVPVVYDLNTTEEKQIQAGLENGVVHYSTTPEPGQTGNVVIVGHSSNNILNKGKYKFAFVLLKKLEVGDTFSLNKDGVRYTYQIFEKKIVKASEVGVLGPSSRPNTATLITCDPPGTSVNRLVVVGEQISPDPSANKAATPIEPELTDKGILPGNSPSLWQRITNFF
jgi:sortase A